jgi:hypothetical protein
LMLPARMLHTFPPTLTLETEPTVVSVLAPTLAVEGDQGEGAKYSGSQLR